MKRPHTVHGGNRSIAQNPYISGAAVLQGRFGCEIERSPDSDIRVTGTFAQYGLNGEDFLSFSLTRGEWEASAEPAVPIKMKWNRDRVSITDTKYYVERVCVTELSDSLYFDSKESQMTSPVTPTVFAKRSNCARVTLTCLVTGFRCRNTTVEVYRDEDILTEEVGLSSSGIRPNGDGTWQLRMSLDISTSTTASYSCEAHLGSLKKHAKWDGVIRNMAEPGKLYDMRRIYGILIVILVVLFILIFGGVRRCANSKL
ncbi:hypothetical protein GJAV_G00122990 [Gymnothorax javanicus]|nr:hypothetical protein GJAV_G00122990 [Gymnothorax javanicus]